MNVVSEKLKEAVLSVVPIIIIVLILNFTISPLDTASLLKFLIGALLIILGLLLFLIGVEICITPIGQLMGSFIAKSNRIWIVAVFGMLFGFLISIAEPDLHILAGQVDTVTLGVISKLSVVIIVSLGVAVLLSLGLVRILYNIPLNTTLFVIYAIILFFSVFSSSEFLAISFDASGATTGALTVPFILALANGVSALKKDSAASEKDSFGLVGITSSGAILSVLIMGVISNIKGVSGSLDTAVSDLPGLIAPFLSALPTAALEIFCALFPILLIFLILQKFSFKLSKERLDHILIGFIYSFAGLVLFITGANAGFMRVGSIMGNDIALSGSSTVLVGTGFALGLVTVLAEPAVHALTNQIEDVTSGYVKKRTVLAALSIGIGFSVALSMLRIIVPGLELWHILLPGYAISIILSYIVPSLFVGIAFDSGGVASGPMTATFILAFAHGAANAIEGADVLIDGFGIIALVALTPLITLQLLGLIYKIQTKKKGIEDNGAIF